MHHSKMTHIPLGIYEGQCGKRLNHLGIGHDKQHHAFRIFHVTEVSGKQTFLLLPTTAGMWDERTGLLHINRATYRLIERFEQPHIP